MGRVDHKVSLEIKIKNLKKKFFSLRKGGVPLKIEKSKNYFNPETPFLTLDLEIRGKNMFF